MFYERLLSEKIKNVWNQSKVLLLLGPRQVGKSTLLRHLFKDYQHIVLDPTYDQYNIKNDPDLFLKSFPAPLVLDEIQYYPELLSALKRKVDSQIRCNSTYSLVLRIFLCSRMCLKV